MLTMYVGHISSAFNQMETSVTYGYFLLQLNWNLVLCDKSVRTFFCAAETGVMHWFIACYEKM